MKSIVLGTRGGTPVKVDLARLIESRLLIQGTSGSGKSHAARRIVEQAEEHVQCVVIDPEGEYATLREKFPFLLFGPGGERAASVHSAGVLARMVLEVGRSAVIDLSEMKGREHVAFVKAFAEGLMSAPKALAHEMLIVIEEAHLFAPEGAKSESTEAVIDLAKRGRKRGYCVIAATQRLSDLSKGVAGILGSRLIGLTTLDTDIKRAAYDLGMEPNEARDQLKSLALGHFFAYGPAFTFQGVERMHVAETETKAPAWSARGKPPPPTPEKLRSVLARMDEIPKEAEEEARSIEDLRKQLATAKRELAARPVEKVPEVRTERVEVPVVSGAQVEAITRAAEESMRATQSTEQAVLALLDGLRKAQPTARPMQASLVRPSTPRPAPGVAVQRQPRPAATAEGLTAPQQRILDTISMLGVRGIHASRESVARWMAIHPNGGSYGTNLGYLRSAGYLEGFALTSAGEAAAAPQDTGVDAALLALPDEPKRSIVRALLDAGKPLSREDLAAALGLHPNGGSYGTNLSWLRTMGIVTARGPIATTEGLLR